MRKFFRVVLLLGFFVCLGSSVFAGTVSGSSGSWQQGPSLTTSRSYATATLLNDGRIAFVGGKDAQGNPLATVDMLKPDGTIAAGPPMSSPRYGHCAVLLADGRVLIAGGRSADGAVLNTAEIFDPNSDTWTPASSVMRDQRADFTMSLLTGGDVLITGGDNGSGPVTSVDRFTPTTGSFTYETNLSVARMKHAASVLKDGRVLITGGAGLEKGGSLSALTSTEIYDPSNNSISAGPALNVGRTSQSSTTLIGGTVLIAGGTNGNSDLASLEVYDPVANTMTLSGATLTTARSGHVALLLPNNNEVLIAGGTSAGASLSSTELYRSWTGSVVANAPMSLARNGAAATALQADGSAILAGGSSALGTDFFTFATVKTDASDYAPGTTVTITGSGWLPGETVTLDLLESPFLDQPAEMSAVADAQGNIFNSGFSPDTYDLNTRFYLTAKGSASQAQTTFTDAANDNTSLTVSCSPNPIPSGGQATCTAEVDDTATSPVGYPKGSVTFSLPAGTGSFTPSSSCDLAQIGSSVKSQCSVTFAPTSAGTVKAQYNRSSNDWNNSASGTVSYTVSSSPQVGSVTVGPQSGTLIYGTAGSVTYTVTVTRTSGTNAAFSADLSTGALPSGVTASFNPSTLSFTTTDNSKTSTLTLTSTSAVAAQSGTAFTVTGTNATLSTDTQSGNGSFTIGQATPTITWISPSAITYGTALTATQLDATASYQVGSVATNVPGTFTYAPALGTILDAGTQTLSVHFTPTDTTDFATPTPDKTVSLTVNQATVTASIIASSKTYDGTNAATFTCSLSGVLAADAGKISCTGGTATFASPSAGTGITVTATGLQITGSRAANYVLASTSATITSDINPASLTLSGVVAKDKTYDGSTTAVLDLTKASLSGMIGSDAVSLNSSAYIASFANKTVGLNKAVTVSGFSLSGASASNYTLSQPTGLSASISPKALTVNGVTAADKVYDGTTNATLGATGAALAGAISGDDVSLVSASATGTFADKNAAQGKTVTVAGLTLSGADAGNYSLTQPTTSASITPKSLTMSGVTASTKVYDGSTTANLNFGAAALQGVISGDVITPVTSAATGSFADKNVGQNKSVTVSGITLSGGDAGNYSLTQPTASASITPKPLTVAGITANNKVYDGNTAATLDVAPAVLQGVVSGDSAKVDTSSAAGSFADKNVGTGKPVTITGIGLTGTDSANYTITQPSATADITAKPLTAIVVVQDKVYDGNTSATVASENLTGVVGQDSVSIGGGTATFSDKNVGVNKNVSITGLVLSGADAGNYSVSGSASSTASISQRGLTVTATATSKTYDGLTAASVTLSDDRVAGDALTEAYTSASFADKNVGSAKTVAVAGISISGGTDAGNYLLANTTATSAANINPRPLTVTAAGQDKMYDGTVSATVTLADNRVTDDVLNDSYTAATFSDKNAGSGKAVSVTGISISGTDAANYSLTSTTASTNASITARLLHVSATGLDRKYDGTMTASVTLSDDRIAGDVFTATYGAASFADKNVGAAKPVTVSNIQISGQDAANYSANATASTSGSITPRMLTITALPDQKVYDAKVVSSATPAISGDGLAADDSASLSEAFDTKNVGSGKTLTPTGSIQDGNNGGNYQVSFVVNQGGSITPRALNVTASGVSKVYDGTTTTKVTLGDDHIAGDAVTDAYASAAFTDKAVGTGKTINVAGITISGADAANYSVVDPTTTATGDITQLTLTVTATASNKVYDGTTNATVTLSDNRVSGDALTDNSTTTTFTDKNVGTGKSVTISGISISGADAGNYSLASTTASTTADITPLPIQLTATTDTKTYDGTTTSNKIPTITSGALASGDTATYSQVFDSATAGARSLLPSASISDGNNGNNYNVTRNNTPGTITPLTITASITAKDKVYDGTNTETQFTCTLTGLLQMDVNNVSCTGGTASFSTSNAGQSLTVTATGLALQGAAAMDYSINTVATTTATITKANQTITWNTPAPMIYGTPLSSTQLNATDAGVTGGTAPGALTYSLFAGTGTMGSTILSSGSTVVAGDILGVGTDTLQVSAAETQNYNATSASVNIAVTYSSGVCLGSAGHVILQPINADGTSNFKQGSTVPAKFRVCDATGMSVGIVGVVKSFTLTNVLKNDAPVVLAEDIVSTTPDSAFRWDPTAQQWIFNISTKNLPSGYTYVYQIGLNDGTNIPFQYTLPK